MQPADDIEKLLAGTPVPTVRDGPHRAALKEELLAQMQTLENAMTETLPANSWQRALQPRWLAAAAAVAAAALLAVKMLPDRAAVAPPAPPAAPSDAGTAVASRPAPRNAPPERESMRRRSLADSVAAAQVIVVGTPLDSTPAPPNVPGDGPESFIRFQVLRVLKGDFAAAVVTVRTPTAFAEFAGRDWVVMLSPENVAGKHLFAGCYSVTLEPEVNAILANPAR